MCASHSQTSVREFGSTSNTRHFKNKRCQLFIDLPLGSCMGSLIFCWISYLRSVLLGKSHLINSWDLLRTPMRALKTWGRIKRLFVCPGSPQCNLSNFWCVDDLIKYRKHSTKMKASVSKRHPLVLSSSRVVWLWRSIQRWIAQGRCFLNVNPWKPAACQSTPRPCDVKTAVLHQRSKAQYLIWHQCFDLEEI